MFGQNGNKTNAVRYGLHFFGGCMLKILDFVNRFVWGVPALLLIMGVGIYLSVRTSFLQIRLLPRAISFFFSKFMNKKEKKAGSSYRALCTALGATVGTGNLAGVAGAIAIGGPGAIFWMWVCGILGMITKFAEAVLSVRYHRKNSTGEWVGGPMYMIQCGMGSGWTWLARVYCFFGVVAAFGVGNATQVNTVVGGINDILTYLKLDGGLLTNLLIGILLAVLITLLLMGGAKKIGKTAENLVPVISLLYIFLCLIVLTVRFRVIPSAFAAIVKGAFSPRAATGGMIGSVFTALRIGASRGVFTNEAGMGTAAIAHGAADVQHPVQQGFMGIVEVFLDTIVICTMTALVILCSGVPVSYGVDSGISLTISAFAEIFGEWICMPITLLLVCLAIATVLGWGLYGGRCAQYLFGDGAWKSFVWLQGVTVIVGAVLNTGVVWMLSETVNGLMAIPNLIALGYLSPELFRLVKEYKTMAYA